jgi:hypothetical protein
LEIIWKEIVMTYFEVLTRNFPGETEEYHGNLQSRQPEYRLGFEPITSRKKKPETLPLGPNSSVCISLNVHHTEKKVLQMGFTYHVCILFYARSVLREAECEFLVSINFS